MVFKTELFVNGTQCKFIVYEVGGFQNRKLYCHNSRDSNELFSSYYDITTFHNTDANNVGT